MAGSPRGSLDGDDFKKLGRNALIAFAGALLTVVSQWISETDFGWWNGFATVLAAGLLDACRRFLNEGQGNLRIEDRG